MMSKLKGNTNKIDYRLFEAPNGSKVTNIPWHGSTYGD